MKQGLLTVVLLALMAAPCVAEDWSTEITMEQIRESRREIVAATVAPESQYASEFWELYRKYRGRMDEVDKRTLKIFEELTRDSDSIDSVRASEVVDEVLKIDAERAKIRKTYVKKFQKILPPGQLVRWYQVESKMDAVARAAMAATIPYIR